MSQQLSRTIGFLCPKCRQSVIVERSLFELTAAPLRVACPCGGSFFQLEYQEDRFVVEAPCLNCGGRHLARCPSGPFLKHKAITFCCPRTGIVCGCVGEEQEVYKAVKGMEAAADALEERGEGEGSFLNQLVTEEMLSELKDIAQRGGVRCTCGSREWNLKVRYSSIELSCAHCRGSLRLSSATMDDLNDLCCRDELVIQGQAAP
jgi:hypothetical protein